MLLEITPDDISLLNDEDLRSLIALLCEYELRRRGLSTATVTWGGNQTAADGGLDVRVALPLGTVIDGFIPRPDTGFQVKKPDMPRAAILVEMRPSGVLRPIIRELADKKGAYIIVSGIGATSDTALRNRRKAMAEAVADLPDPASLSLSTSMIGHAWRHGSAKHLDSFFGCGRRSAGQFEAGSPMAVGPGARPTRRISTYWTRSFGSARAIRPMVQAWQPPMVSR